MLHPELRPFGTRSLPDQVQPSKWCPLAWSRQANGFLQPAAAAAYQGRINTPIFHVCAEQ